MRIVDLLKKQSIDLNASVADKAAAIDHLVDLMAAGGNLNDKELYKQRVLAREQEGSTGIGEGIAIPHAKTEAVNEPGLASMIVRDASTTKASTTNRLTCSSSSPLRLAVPTSIWKS